MSLPQSPYPLAWPVGHPRTRLREASRFTKPVSGCGASRNHSMAEGVALVHGQLQTMGVNLCVISTNVELRIDGLPRSDRRAPSDPGVAVYFKLRGRDIVLPCDKRSRVECNLWAMTGGNEMSIYDGMTVEQMSKEPWIKGRRKRRAERIPGWRPPASLVPTIRTRRKK